LEQVLDIAERGRSLGVVLFSAQQFMSAVHPRVTGNCATKILGRVGSSEISTPGLSLLGRRSEDEFNPASARGADCHPRRLSPAGENHFSTTRLPAAPARNLNYADNETALHAAAKKLAEKTLAAAQYASNEAEFRIPFQAAIAEAALAIGAPIQPRRRSQPHRRPGRYRL